MPDDNLGGPVSPVADLPAAPTFASPQPPVEAGLTDPVMPVSTPEPVAPPVPTFDFDLPTMTTEPTPPVTPAIPTQPVAEAPALDFMKPKLAVETPLPPTPTPPSPAGGPAALPPRPRSAAPVFIILLLLICVVSIATAAFFWMQNQALIAQITTVQQTLEHRETPEPTPTPSATPSATPTATISAAPKLGLTAFTNIAAVVALAQTNSPTAQLLMITGDHLQDPSLITFKYYFRKGPTNKSYIYVQQTGDQAPQLFTQASVTPDNDIPDLAPTLVGNKGGIDSDGAWKLIQSSFLPTSVKNLSPTNISVMYLNTVPPNSPEITTPVLLWQFVIKYATVPDVVVQLGAVTQKLIYTNSPTVTPAP